MHRIEIDAGGRGDVCPFQHLFGELETVGGEVRDIGIKIECAVGRQEFLKAGFRQALDQDAAVFQIAALDRLHLLGSVERRFCRDLRQRRYRDRKVLLQPLDRADQRFRRHHPAHPPAGHAEIFRERVDDERIRRQFGCRHRRKRIVETMIDFVGYEADACALGRLYQARKRVAGHHGAGRIGWTSDQHALQPPLAMRGQQGFAGQGVAGFARRLDQHRLAAERGQDVPVRRIAGHGHRDAVARLEHREKCQDEGA